MSSRQSPTPSLSTCSTFSGGSGGAYVSDDGSYDGPESEYNEDDQFGVVGSPASSNGDEERASDDGSYDGPVGVTQRTTGGTTGPRSTSAQGAAGARSYTGGTAASGSTQAPPQARSTTGGTTGSTSTQGDAGTRGSAGGTSGSASSHSATRSQAGVRGGQGKK
jgi:hypothetical protein